MSPWLAILRRFACWWVFAVVLSATAMTRYSVPLITSPPASTNSFVWENALRLLNNQPDTKGEDDQSPLGLAGTNSSQADSLAASVSLINLNVPYKRIPTFGKRQQVAFGVAIASLVSILIIRRLSPKSWLAFNQRYNPWAVMPEASRAVTENVRAESAPFDRFVTKFHVGPDAPSVDKTPRPADLARNFCGTTAEIMARQRSLVQKIVGRSSGLARQNLLTMLATEMGWLQAAANFPRALPVWQVATALEGLLKQLTEKMGNVTPSSLSTVVTGVQLLDDLCATGLPPGSLTERPLKFLVVDDDLISRYALAFSLRKAFSEPDVVADANAALLKLNVQAYDVIFLDVQMPGMDGFELCLKAHQTALNQHTPIVFVSGISDFNARARTTLCGGNDLMGKPFLTFEVTVKALNLALHGRLHGRALSSERDHEWVKSLLDSFVIDEPVVSETRFVPGLPVRIPPEEFNRIFLKRALQHINPLRLILLEARQAPDAGVRQSLLADVFLRLNSLVSEAGSATRHPAYLMTTALEGLLRKLMEDARHYSGSTMGTLTAAVDVLHELCAPGTPADLTLDPEVSILVVDDDLVSRRVLTLGVQTCFPRPETAESGEAAVALAATRAFDLVFMDVVMPGMDGFAACAKIRETVPNWCVPVILVTGQPLNQISERIRAIDGADYLAKPYLVAELTVKALTHVLRGRLRGFEQSLDFSLDDTVKPEVIVFA